MRLDRKLLVIVLLILPVLSLSGTAQDRQVEIRDSMMKKVFMLRGFPSDKRITYSATGEPITPIKQGPWALGGIRVEKIEFTPQQTSIRGKRIGLTPDGEYREFKVRKNALDESVELTIQTSLAELEENAFSEVFYKIFLRNDEDWSDLVPYYWRSYMKNRYLVQHGQEPEKEPTQTYPYPIGRVGGSTSAPKPIDTPDPDYEEAAKKAKFQGVVVLHLIVDETGAPRNIRIQRMLGLGLDDRAVEAVRKWRFHPAKRDGKPVAVAINVEVNFNLY